MVLSSLKAGKKGVIRHTGGSREMQRRLLDMGLTPGSSVQMIGTALLGDPLILRVRGVRISLRRELARQIDVQAGGDKRQ